MGRQDFGDASVFNGDAPGDRRTVADGNLGGYAKQWRRAHYTRWSKLDSDQYEQLIGLIRDSLKSEPLWKIEEYWKGNQ